MSEIFDYVIVGAGSAGCVLAMPHSEAGHPVCVPEAGTKDSSPYIHIPTGYIKNLFNPKLVWNFASEPNPVQSSPLCDIFIEATTSLSQPPRHTPWIRASHTGSEGLCCSSRLT